MKGYLLAIVCTIAVSCRTTKSESVYKTATDTEVLTTQDSTNKTRTDTEKVYIRDSIFLYQKNDTITKEVFKTRYIYRCKTDTFIKVLRDTAFVCKTDTVYTNKEVVKVKRAHGIFGAAAGLILLYAVIYFIRKRL